MTTDDDAFIARLRERALGDGPASGLAPGSVLAASRRKRRVIRAAGAAAVLAVGALAVVGVADLVGLRDGAVNPVIPVTTADPVDSPTPSPSPTPEATFAMCAEFPPQPPSGPSYEGWWSSSPAAEGGILTDPADWPPIMREHPQTALVDTRTGKVLESFDRYACGPMAGYVVPAGIELPPDAVVVLDAMTGEILEAISPPAFEPQW